MPSTPRSLWQVIADAGKVLRRAREAISPEFREGVAKIGQANKAALADENPDAAVDAAPAGGDLAPETQRAEAKDDEDGYQTVRVEEKLRELKAEGVVLGQHTRLDLRRMIENKFDKSPRVKGLGTPSRQAINRVLAKHPHK
jgi:hypothetical protein